MGERFNDFEVLADSKREYLKPPSGGLALKTNKPCLCILGKDFLSWVLKWFLFSNCCWTSCSWWVLIPSEEYSYSAAWKCRLWWLLFSWLWGVSPYEAKWGVLCLRWLSIVRNSCQSKSLSQIWFLASIDNLCKSRVMSTLIGDLIVRCKQNTPFPETLSRLDGCLGWNAMSHLSAVLITKNIKGDAINN